MTLIHIVTIAIIQGITEFLPISSSAHLIILPHIFGWQDQGLAIDVALHFGTLLAVSLYFKDDMQKILHGSFDYIFRKNTENAKLVNALITATIPVMISGLLMTEYVNMFRSISIIGWTTFIFGLLLWYSDIRGSHYRDLTHLRTKDALIIGLFQILALVPGVSRAGITMTAALLLGFSRTESAKFSLLLSIPTIVAASTVEIYAIYKTGDQLLQSNAIIGAGISFITAYFVIKLMMNYIAKFSFKPFVLYRVLLGGILILYTVLYSA